MEGIRTRYILIFMFMGLLLPSLVYAADFNIQDPSGSLNVNQEFIIQLRINSKGETINAAQATLSFPPQYLEVVNINYDHSVFNFWLQQPEYDNLNGKIDFIGGTPSGVSGESLYVLQITFRTKGPTQSATILYDDGSITIADGSGNNILEKSNGANYLISSTQITPPISKIANQPTPTKTVTPITRPPATSTGLPGIPKVSIPIYPDQSKWYSRVEPFNIIWDVPSDIDAISTAFNQTPNFVPPKNSEGLFNQVSFPSISTDGIYYFHVRFRNNIGWGPTTHYKISVDTQPPEPPNAIVLPSAHSTDPTPIIQWDIRDNLSGVFLCSVETSHTNPFIVCREDEVSSIKIPEKLRVISRGIDYLNVRNAPSLSGDLMTRVNPGEEFEYTSIQNNWYNIIIDEDTTGWVFGDYIEDLNQEDFLALASSKELGPLEPGTYFIDIVVVDNAGNAITESVEIEVIPLETPVITFISKDLIVGEGLFKITGNSNPDFIVELNVRGKNNNYVLHEHIHTENEGDWRFNATEFMPRGTYEVTVRAENSDGALSLESDPVIVKVREKPLIVIGTYNITLMHILILAGIVIAVFILSKLKDFRFKITKVKRRRSKK